LFGNERIGFIHDENQLRLEFDQARMYSCCNDPYYVKTFHGRRHSANESSMFKTVPTNVRDNNNSFHTINL